MKIDKIMNIRAWSVVKNTRGIYIIVGFNHKNNTVSLARWLHPIDVSTIRAIMPLCSEFEISNEQLDEMKILFTW